MNLAVAREAVLAALRARRKGYICVTGVHGVVEAQDDESFRSFARRCAVLLTNHC